MFWSMHLEILVGPASSRPTVGIASMGSNNSFDWLNRFDSSFSQTQVFLKFLIEGLSWLKILLTRLGVPWASVTGNPDSSFHQIIYYKHLDINYPSWFDSHYSIPVKCWLKIICRTWMLPTDPASRRQHKYPVEEKDSIAEMKRVHVKKVRRSQIDKMIKIERKENSIELDEILMLERVQAELEMEHYQEIQR